MFVTLRNGELAKQICYHPNGDVLVDECYYGNANNEPNLLQRLMTEYSLTIDEVIEQTKLVFETNN